MYSELKEVYSYFSDEESKMIFRQKLLYALTGDWNYFRELLLYYRNTNKTYTDILDVIENPNVIDNKEVVLFGCGVWGHAFKNILSFCGKDFDFYCDNNPTKCGKIMNGKTILSVQQLLNKHRGATIIISSDLYKDEMLQQLQNAGFPNDQIIRFSYCERKIYFDEEIMKCGEDEVFIDGGCYDGTTSFEFMEWAEGHARKIYAFEPDSINYQKCVKNMKEKCKIDYEIVEAGLWNEKTTLKFKDEHGVGARINKDGTSNIATETIDSIVGENPITFLKLDIEGAELMALHGAKTVITRDKPKLAICLYHKPEDILEIPKYIKQLVPEYKFYIRHYIPYFYDTVLYAVIE